MQARVLQEPANQTQVREAPPLFPPRTEEFRKQTLSKTDEDLLLRHRSLVRIYTTSPYYYTEATRQKDVERYSDNYLSDDSKLSPETVLHLQSSWLPTELRSHNPKARPMLKRKRAPSPSLPSSQSNPASPINVPTSLMSLLLPSEPEVQGEIPQESRADTVEKKRKRQRTEKENQVEQTIELDFANLQKHTVNELRQFCRERKLAVGGRRKQEFIAAITAYHATNKSAEKEKGDRKNKKSEKQTTKKRKGEDTLGAEKMSVVPPADGQPEKRVKYTPEEGNQSSESPAGSGVTEIAVGMDKMSRLEYQEQQALEDGQDFEETGDNDTLAREYEDMDEEENDYVEAHGFDDDEGEAGEDDEDGNDEDYL